jgi:hypothetical protein
MKILKTTSVILSLVLFLAIGCEKNTQIKPTLDKSELKSVVVSEKSFDLYVLAYYNNSLMGISKNPTKLSINFVS